MACQKLSIKKKSEEIFYFNLLVTVLVYYLYYYDRGTIPHKLCLLLVPFSTRRMHTQNLLYLLCVVLKINYFELKNMGEVESRFRKMVNISERR